MKTVRLLLVFLLLSCCSIAQNLVSNGDFSSTTGWTKTGYFQYDSRFSNYHNAAGYAYLADTNGLPKTSISGTLSQVFYIPNSPTGITISLWYRITTAETGVAAKDTCGFWLEDQSTFALTYLGRLSNLNSNTAYQPLVVFLPNLPTSRNYKIVFSASNDATFPTVFRLDDILVTSNPTYSANCISWAGNKHPSPMVDSAMNKLCMYGIINSSQDTNTLSGLITKSEIARYIGRTLLQKDSLGILAFMDYLPDLLDTGRKSIVPATDRPYVKLMQYLEYSNGYGGTDNIAPFPRNAFFPSYGGSMLKSDAVRALLESWNLSQTLFYDPTNSNPTPGVCDILRNYPNCDYISRAAVLGLFAGMSTPCGSTGIYYGTDNQITYREFYVMLSRMIGLYHKPIDYSDFFLPNQYYYNNLTSTGGIEKGAFQDYSGKGVQIPSGGPGLEFEFAYHSGLTEIPYCTTDTILENTVGLAKQYPLGQGWTHTYSAFIKSLSPVGNTPSRILIYWPDGAVHSYLVSAGKYETKGITDQLTIDSFNAVNQPAQVRIRRGRTTYTFRNIDKGLYCVLSLITITDGSGNKVGLNYSDGYSPISGFEPKLLTTVTDSFSMRSLQFTYDATSNYLKTVTDPANRQLSFYVNLYYRDLDSSKDAKGQTTSYSPDLAGGAYRSHLLLSIRRPNGNYINNQYAHRKLTQSGSLSQQIYVQRPLQYQSPLASQNSQVTTIQSGVNITTGFSFDGAGNTTNQTSDIAGIQRVYDTATNRLLVERDLKLGMIKKFGYDANGFLNKTVIWDSVAGDSIRYEYVNNSFGEVTLLKDENDGYTETKFYRNTAGLPTKIVTNENTGGEIHHNFSYFSNGLLSSYQDPVERQTNYTYNSYGNLTRVDKFPYPITGGFTILTESYSYDLLSRLIKHKNYVGDSIVYSYDNNDNLLSETKDPGGLNLMTSYAYDANDNDTSIISPKGHKTTLKYDFNTDDLLEENDGTDKKKWRYNQDGTLDSFINKNGVVFKSVYYNNSLFPGNKLNGLFYSDGYRYWIYYDSSKNLHRVIYNGKENINWIDRGKWNIPSLVGTQNYFSSLAYDAVSYEYDQHQRPSLVAYQSFSSTNSDPYHLSYYYEPYMHWLTQVYEDNRGKSYVKYDYQKDSKPTIEIYGNGDTTFHHYDGHNRLDSIWAHNKFGQLIYSIGATLDAAGRHTRENLQIVYQSSVDTSLPQYPSATSSYSYQTRNRILTGNGRTFHSDNAGNIDTATSPSIGLTWSVYGQLLGVNRGSSQTAYEYDGLGIRRRKDATYYVVSQNNGNVLVESTQSGTGISTYIWGNGLVCRINPQNDSEYYYHYDFRGSVVCITNQNGQVIQFYKYDPYGRIYAQKGNLSWTNPYRYLGRYGCQTDDSDLYYCKARYYQPSTGRFVSEDPRWNTNLFVYGNDDPINRIDPDGQEYEGISNWLANRKWFYNWANSSKADAAIPVLEFLSKGRFVGTQFGEKAQDYYQNAYTQSVLAGKPNNLYLIGFGISSLWTSKTYLNTLELLTVETEFTGKSLTQDIGKSGKYLKILDMRTRLGRYLKSLQGGYDAYETIKTFYQNSH